MVGSLLGISIGYGKTKLAAAQVGRGNIFNFLHRNYGQRIERISFYKTEKNTRSHIVMAPLKKEIN